MDEKKNSHNKRPHTNYIVNYLHFQLEYTRIRYTHTHIHFLRRRECRILGGFFCAVMLDELTTFALEGSPNDDDVDLFLDGPLVVELAKVVACEGDDPIFSENPVSMAGMRRLSPSTPLGMERSRR